MGLQDLFVNYAATNRRPFCRQQHLTTRQGRGFVLVATLWVLLAMTLFISYFSELVEESQDQALHLKDSLQTRLDQQATLATLLYLASTRPMTYAGLTTPPYERKVQGNPLDGFDPFLQTSGELRLDGRLYKGIGQTNFRLQDAGSLISLRGDDHTRLKKLLDLNKIGEGHQERLIANLLDYSDRDSLLNLNGAEFSQYSSAGISPPANRFLVSPMQLLNVLDWNRYLDREQFLNLISEVTIYVANRENFNSMTKPGMRTIGSDGIDIPAIDMIQQHRMTESFSSIGEVNQLTGSLIPLDPFVTPFFPSKYIRLSLQQTGLRQAEWLGITLTPDSRFAPWTIDYRFKLDAPPINGTVNRVENTVSALFH